VRAFTALLLKEEAALFSSPIAYVVLTVFLVLMGYTFTVNLFLDQLASLVHLFFQMYVLLLLSIPIITMRLLAEERRLRTLELLLTSPVTEAQVVLAKYLASMTLVLLMVALSGSCALVLGIFGEPNWGPIYGGYLGLVLLGSALVSIGLLASSLTANQLIAALLSLGVFLLLWVIDDFGWILPMPFDTLSVNMSLSTHFVPFAIGSLYLSDAGFFLSLTLLGLFLAVRALGRR
jgi:gliding motility-associated transport system permease protein